jgi:hypothetical protein
MAAPVIAATADNEATASTTPSATLPSGISSGDLLLVLCSAGGSATWQSISGWSLDGGVPGAIYYRVADGTEGSSVTLSMQNAQKASFISLRITGAASSNYYFTTGSQNAGAPTATTPQLSPSYGTADYLFISALNYDGTPTVSSYPSGYTAGNVNHVYAGGGAASTKGSAATAAKGLTNVSTETPTSYTLSTSPPLISQGFTVAIRGIPTSTQKTYSIDAKIIVNAKAYFLDADLFKTIRKTYSVASVLFKTSTKTHSIDTAIFGAPQNLVATPISSTRVDLSWTAVPSALIYQIERDGSIIATSATNSYSDTTVVASTTYNYRVRALGGG